MSRTVRQEGRAPGDRPVEGLPRTRDGGTGGSRVHARGGLPNAAGTLAAALSAGCGGPQSALDPAGTGAAAIATLWWWMAAGALVIWAGVVALTIYALKRRRRAHDPRAATLLIVTGGAAVPTVVLGALLVWGLSLLPDLLEPGPPGGLRIEVVGEEWWWRVRYHVPGAEPVELANEVRLPVGERVELTLRSADVIHSFWIPALGGKMDLIPGRVTRLALEPTRTGVFRGVCAEFCGASHAFMAFAAVVMEPEAFDGWLQGQRAPAAEPPSPRAAAGRDAFLANGCGACHTVRGLPAEGVVGPDLTHVGSRLGVGAGLLQNDPAGFRRWLEATEALKPSVHMPSFGMLPEEELRALALWLDGLS